jgi:hypothetical protein
VLYGQVIKAKVDNTGTAVVILGYLPPAENSISVTSPPERVWAAKRARMLFAEQRQCACARPASSSTLPRFF